MPISMDEALDPDLPATAPKPDSAQMALDRTWLAHERTLMAWVRTAASQISFGFTIYKFFEFETRPVGIRRGFITPRDFAVILVGIGILALLGAAIQHRKEVRRMSPYFAKKPFSMAGLIASLISALGILTLVSAILNR
jgi:putative membrane protein